MSIATKFEKFVKNLKTTNHATIANRYNAITRRLNADFWGIDSETRNSRYVGSYGRGTSITGFSDVDFMMILPKSVYDQYNGYSGNGQSALLQAVKNSVKKTYDKTHMSGDGQVVVINFSDGVKFEIVPSFLTPAGDYLYPDTNNGGTWKLMSPIKEIEAINRENANYKKKVKHLVRMMKAWKKKHDVPITGFLLEVFAMKFMKEWQHNDKSYLYYDYMTRDFLLFLSNQNPSQEYWIYPGSGKRAKRKGTFERKAKVGYNLALEAIEYEGNGHTSSANVKWREIFGGYFEG